AATISAKDGQTSVDIPPQPDPPNQTYYLQLTTTQGEIRILGRDEDIYPRGTAFVDDQPVAGDLAFRATYDYDAKAALADLKAGCAHWWLILPLGAILLLPGWLLLDFSGLRKRFDDGEQIAISVGLSLAAIPLLMLWTTTLGLRWGPVSVWVGAGVLAVLFVWRVAGSEWRMANGGWRMAKNDHRPPTADRSTLHAPRSSFATRYSPFIILLAIFALTLFIRFAMVRDLAAPAWVDSVHHGVITRLIIEAGGFPESYAPLLPIEASQYHPGFHSVLATFHWLSGLEIPETMLILGQVLNALMVFAVYLLSKTFTKDQAAGLAAALISGICTLLPAYYTSWGRYTQLMGLLVLPVGLALFVVVAEAIPKIAALYGDVDAKAVTTSWKLCSFLLGSIAFAGSFLIHYRVAAFLGCLLAVYVIGQIRWQAIPAAIKQLAIIGTGSILLVWPWLMPTLTELIIPKGQVWEAPQVPFEGVNWRFLTPVFGKQALVLAGVGVIWGIIKRQRFVLVIMAWVSLLFVLANPGAMGVPLPNFVNQTSVDITLFMPVALLGGYVVGQLVAVWRAVIPHRWHGVGQWAVVLLGAGISVLGAQRLLPTLNPVTFLFREADKPAMRWIDQNIPDEAVILINPTEWGYGLYMGNDGGFWIAPLTGHQTMPPPVLYGMGSREYVENVNAFAKAVLAPGDDAAQLWDYMQTRGITYVYIGARGGILSPRSLAESPRFDL
ncbi:MAG: hypothetical protein KKD28_04680, partial [Chloroflexi bacterium]|nr:hypothetical protein [Chloroflexota bacterium]